MKRSKAIISCIALACTFILCSSASAFKNDPQVLGEWKSIDFVSNISDFKPGTKSWKGNLYLKEFEFHKGGSTHKPFWTWTKGHVYHEGDASDAKYIVKNINGENYLFLEWMSGDVLIRKQKPKYYVFVKKEVAYETNETFVDDPEIIGKWKSVDFVSNISDFKPDAKSWKGDLYLKEFEFHKGGSTHKPYWTWTKGHVYHKGDQTDAKYTVEKIDGEDYLFLEWMSGDVTIRGRKPKHYVLKRR